MRKYVYFLLLFLVLTASCGGGKSDPSSEKVDSTSLDTISQDNDRTLYGRAGEFGMSTFSLITEDGDTLYLTRTRSDGTEAVIVGSLREGDRYAMTVCDDGEAIERVVNLTQLERRLNQYKIINARVVRERDTLNILRLTDDTLEIQ